MKTQETRDKLCNLLREHKTLRDDDDNRSSNWLIYNPDGTVAYECAAGCCTKQYKTIEESIADIKEDDLHIWNVENYENN